MLTAPAQEPPSASVPGPWFERRFWTCLVSMCLLGAFARTLMLVEYIRHNPLAGTPLNDAETYWTWAGEIARGQLTRTEPFFSAPLYPYLLGLLRTCGGALAGAYVIQMLLTLVTAILLAATCRRRFGAGVALLATALFLLLQEPASAALRILDSVLQLLVVTTIWALLVRTQSRPSWRNHIAAGAGLGLLCLAYAPALVLVPAVPVWLIWQSPRRVAAVGRAAATALAAALVISPATLLNWHACGELIFVRSGGGVALAQGNQPDSRGIYTPLAGIDTRRSRMYRDVAQRYREANPEPFTWVRADRFFRNQALQYWRANPGPAAELAARKAYLFIAARNYADIYEPSAEIAAGLNRTLRLAPLPVPWLIGPALVGLALLLRRPRHSAPEWLLFLVPFLVVVFVFYSPRYRVPALPIVVVAAAWAIERGLHWRVYGRQSAVVAAALLVGPLTGLINRAVGNDLLDPTNVPFNLAYALREQGHVAEAAEQVRQGLQFAPHDVKRRVALAELLSELHRPQEALAEYEQVRRLAPDEPGIIAPLAKALIQLRRLDEAEVLLTTAVQQHGDDPTLLGELAIAKAGRGQFDQAEQTIARALALAPDAVELRLTYADILGWQGKQAEARGEFMRAIRAAPRQPAAYHRLGVIEAQMGDLTNARAHLELSLVLQPRDPQVWHDLGVLDLKEGRLDDAIAHFRRALGLDPTLVATRRALQQAGQLRAAQSGVSPRTP